MKDENRFLTFSEWLSEKGMTKKEYNKEKNYIGPNLFEP